MIFSCVEKNHSLSIPKKESLEIENGDWGREETDRSLRKIRTGLLFRMRHTAILILTLMHCLRAMTLVWEKGILENCHIRLEGIRILIGSISLYLTLRDGLASQSGTDKIVLSALIANLRKKMWITNLAR